MFTPCLKKQAKLFLLLLRETSTKSDNFWHKDGKQSKGNGKGWTLDIAPQVDTATAEALRYMAHTKRRRTYLPYTFPAVAGTYLPTPRGWRAE